MPTGDDPLTKLKQGNLRFKNWEITEPGSWRPLATPEWGHPNLNAALREKLMGGQHPFAIVVCCADSRVPPELIFDQGLGDLFVVRTAGHVLDDAAMGSIEYGVHHGFGPLVVLGHGKCGAVDETMKVVNGGKRPGGKLESVIDYITPAVEWALTLGDQDLLARSVDMNARGTVLELMRNAVVQKAVETSNLRVSAMCYDLAGSVTDVPWALYVAAKSFKGYKNSTNWHSDTKEELGTLESQRGPIYPFRLMIRSGTVIDAVQMWVETAGTPMPLRNFGGTGGREAWIDRESLSKVRRIKVFGAPRSASLGCVEVTITGESTPRVYGTSREVDLGEWRLEPGEVPIGFAGSWRSTVDGLSLLTGYWAGTPPDTVDAGPQARTSEPLSVSGP